MPRIRIPYVPRRRRRPRHALVQRPANGIAAMAGARRPIPAESEPARVRKKYQVPRRTNPMRETPRRAHTCLEPRCLSPRYGACCGVYEPAASPRMPPAAAVPAGGNSTPATSTALETARIARTAPLVSAVAVSFIRFATASAPGARGRGGTSSGLPLPWRPRRRNGLRVFSTPPSGCSIIFTSSSGGDSSTAAAR